MIDNEWQETYLIITKNNLGFVVGDYNNKTIDLFENDKKGLKKLLKYIEKELSQEISIKSK